MSPRLADDTATMVAWCEAVGLNPSRILKNDFTIQHEGKGGHVAVYTLLSEPEPGRLVNLTGPREHGVRLPVDTLPYPCGTHPNVPAIFQEEPAVSSKPKTKARTWTMQDIAAELGLAPSTVWAYRTRGQMPAPTGMVGRTPYWDAADIEPWIATRPSKVAAQPAAPAFRVELYDATSATWRPLRRGLDDDSAMEWTTKGAADRARQRYARKHRVDPKRLRTREVSR